MLFESLNNVFKYGKTVNQYKSEFLYRLYENYNQSVNKENEIESQIRSKLEGNIKQKCLDLWKKSSLKQNDNMSKIDKFYLQNLKIKSFFILLRYSRKRKEIRLLEEHENSRIQDFKRKIFFSRWKRAYTHKMNMLANRKWFKVKFSDYWRWKKWIEAQMNVDIIPEFDKFITNPYPKVSNMINTSRVEKEDNSFTLQRSDQKLMNTK